MAFTQIHKELVYMARLHEYSSSRHFCLLKKFFEIYLEMEFNANNLQSNTVKAMPKKNTYYKKMPQFIRDLRYFLFDKIPAISKKYTDKQNIL